MLWWTLRQLQSSDPKTRLQAARKLGQAREARAVANLYVQLDDENLLVREAVIEALARIGAPAVHLLVLGLGFEPREAAARVLVKMGALVVERLTEAVAKTGDPARQESAARVLGEIGDARAIPGLAAAVRDKHERVREAASEALLKFGEQVVDRVLPALQDSNWEVRKDVVRLLYCIGEPRAVGPLLPLLKDENKEVRREVAEVLGEFADPRAVEPLLGVLDDANSSVRAVAVSALGEISDRRALGPLATRLKDPDWPNWSLAGEALARLRRFEALELVAGLLQDESASARKAAAAALGKIRDPRAVDLLTPALQDQEGAVRQEAAAALGETGDQRAINPLRAVLNDSDLNVRLAAQQALRRLEPK